VTWREREKQLIATIEDYWSRANDEEERARNAELNILKLGLTSATSVLERSYKDAFFNTQNLLAVKQR